MITTLIVDDHAVSRAGIRVILRSIPKLTVVAEAADGFEAIRAAKKYNPDIIFMDIQMPGIDGLETTRKISVSNPCAKIIIISRFIDDPYPARLLQAGASGYISKSCAADEIPKAIKHVLLGKCYMSPAVTRQLALDNTRYDDAVSFNVLSLREMQIVLMIIEGKEIAEIANTLYVSQRTIRAHRYEIFKKLNLRNDVELVLLARKLGCLKEIE